MATRGFEDLLWLRRQDRPELYDLARDHPPPLVARDHVVGVAERMGPAGVLTPLAEAEEARVVAAVRALDPAAVAVALLFAFRHPAHERQLAAALRAVLPGRPVVASHEVLPVFREYERTSTTTVEAYLRPRVSAYLAGTAAEVERRGIAALRIMTSAGGSLAPQAAVLRAEADLVFEFLWFACHGRWRFLRGICIHGGNSFGANVRLNPSSVNSLRLVQ